MAVASATFAVPVMAKEEITSRAPKLRVSASAAVMDAAAMAVVPVLAAPKMASACALLAVPLALMLMAPLRAAAVAMLAAVSARL